MICGHLWGNAAVEHRARLEIEGLLEVGYCVRALTQQPVDAGVRHRWPELVALEPAVMPPSAAMSHRTSTKQLSFMAAAARFMRRVGTDDLAAVVSHAPAGVVGAYLLARRRRIPLIYVCHTSPRPVGRGLPTRHRLAAHVVLSAIEGVALRVADLVVCPAASSRDYYARHRPRRQTIALENPVNTRLFVPDPTVSKDVDLLYVGRLAPEKGPAVLLRAVARLPEPVRVVIIGGGSERANLEQLARDCAGPITFLGVLANDDLVLWYQRARIVAVPSFTEAAGMVAVEAMACATPVLASNVTGLVDTVVDGSNGWLAPPGDERAWAEALHALLAEDDRLRAAGERARETAQRFDSRDFGARVVEAYGLRRA